MSKGLTMIKRCSQCVLSASFPRVSFDKSGVCNFCRDEMYYLSDYEVISQAKKEIEILFENERGKGSYDALCCYSGGKDSTYTLMLAAHTYGLRLLSFTLDNGYISPAAFENIYTVTDTLGVDHITFRPSKKIMRKIFKTSATHQLYNRRTMTRISAGCQACISMVHSKSLELAIEKQIPFIIAGFTLGQIPHNSIYYKNNLRFLAESRQPVMHKLKSVIGDEVGDYYETISSSIDPDKIPYNVNLLCLEDISEENIIRSIEKIGWVKPTGVDGCSSNCIINSFNNYVHTKKFGFNPYELELSHLIRKKLLTREEALEKLNDQPHEQIIKIFTDLDLDESDIHSEKK